MFLKSLEMQGFKSFPDKTIVRFNRGLTAVVGPNGSGKSNLSDAMRWVLGEQSTKTLRGEKMEDVIFLGTSSRKAQGFAAVSLTFDNADRFLAADADEVTVTRRYYRSGESEYQINGQDVRLRDINELFMDTGLGRDGYSMIGQGKIAEIISARSADRRQIFEEAAGISKYRYRKAEAERRLASAEENLVRLYDILSELEGRVAPLRIQSEKAREFLTLSQRKKTLEVSLWLLALAGFEEVFRVHQNKYLIAQGEDQQLARDISRTEEKIQEAYSRMQSCLTRGEEYQTLRQNLQNRIAQLGQDEAVCRNDITHYGGEISRLEEELAILASGEEKRQEEIQRLSAVREAALAQEKELEEGLAAHRQALHILTQEQSGFTGKFEEANQAANQIALDISKANMTILTQENAAVEEEARYRAAQEEEAVLETKLEAGQETLDEVDGLLGEISSKLSDLDNAAKGYSLKLSGRQEKLEEIRGEQQRLDLAVKEKLQKAKLLQDLEQNLEGFPYSVKAIIKAGKNGVVRGILGTVAQLLDVDAQYTMALETALGGALQNLIVEDAAAAKAGIRYLAGQKAGRATFLPVSEMKGGNILSEPGLQREDGFVAIASELVRYDKKFSGIVRFLLGRIAVAEDLDAASAIARKYGYRFRIVTLDGQQVNTGGSFTGGSASRSSGILSRKNEAAALEKEAAALNMQKGELDRRAKEIEAEAAALSAQLEGVWAEQRTAREDQIRFEGDKKRYQQSQSQLVQRREELSRQQAAAAKKIEDGKAVIREARKDLTRLEEKARKNRAELAAIAGNRDTLSTRRERLLEEIAQLGREELSAQKDAEELFRRVEELEKAGQDQENRKQALETKLRETCAGRQKLMDTILSLQEEGKVAARQVADYEEKSKALIQLRQEIEGETTRLRQEEREISAQKERTAGELARLEEQKLAARKDCDQLIRQLMDEYELTRTEAKEQAIDIPDKSAAQQELNTLKNRIRGLGSVNLGAIEEYQEVSERYAFLKAQVEDAAGSKAELERLIRNLTADMERMFLSSFQAINENFGRIFAELFGGGRASLSLSNPESVLSSGIEIAVQPPGKIIKNLEALSGGEQAFVAIAIYFAILKVRPAPFCVLDEIEAALDDVNVVKYAAYLRMISDSTQFILITHRRGTMEEADVLYGVTMQEQGVSKLLELKVSEIAGQFAEEDKQ